MTRPTRALGATVGLAGLLHLVAQVSGDSWLALGSGAALALPLVALLYRPRLAQLAVAVGPARAVVGGGLTLDLAVRQTGSGRSAPALLTVVHPAVEHPPSLFVPSLAGGGQVRLSVRLVGQRRGVWGQLPVRLESTAPLGLLLVRRDLTVPTRQVCYPAPLPARLPPEPAAGETGAASVAQSGPGLEVLGLRPWRSGDPGRWIHARSTARHGQPMVLERERGAGRGLVLVADGAPTGDGYERAVGRSLTMAARALAAGDPVQLFGGGPATNPTTLPELQDWLAQVAPAAPADPATLAAAMRAARAGRTVLVLAGAGAGAAAAAATRAGARLLVLDG